MSYQSLGRLVTQEGATVLPEQGLSPNEAQQVEIEVKYAGYVSRQQNEVLRQAEYENQTIPADLDYSLIKGLSNEVRLKLQSAQPLTVGQASRVSGVTPAAISLLLVYLKRQGLAKHVS